MTDQHPRNLIQRLAEKLDLLHCQYNVPNQSALIDEAYAYLSQPEPEELTDEEILDLSQEHQVSYTMCDGGVIYPLQAGANMRDDVLSFARAVIAADRARWGRPAVQPIPVSERPWEREGWCDNNGWCWCFDADDTDPFWSFDRPEAWVCWTHVLPHYALPIPEPTTQETP